MPRRTATEPVTGDLDEAMAERRIDWLIRPLVVPPTTDSRVIAYLAEVAADARAEVAAHDAPSERLMALEALLRSRPLPAECGFSRQWSCWDWVSRFMRSADVRWDKDARCGA